MKRVLSFLNYFFIFCLLVSYLAPFVSAEHFTFIAFFGLVYPFLVLINLGFVIFWLILWKKKFIFSLLTIAGGWFLLSNYWSFNVNSSPPSLKNCIKVSSYNVRVFDFYNWEYHEDDKTRIKQIELIKDQDADIICLQEFISIDNPLYKFNTLDTLLQLLNPVYYHFDCALHTSRKQMFGLITFSKFPIVKEGKIEFDSEGLNSCMFTDIKKGNDTIRIYNMHLESAHLKDSHFVYLRKYDEDTIDNTIDKSKNIMRHLSIAFKKRAIQADKIAESIRTCKYPVIVCGDLNDTPSSYTYSTIKGNLVDAFKESGIGFGATYAGKIPFLRIDYIFHSPKLKSYDFNINPEKLSDHYPISCVIQLPE